MMNAIFWWSLAENAFWSAIAALGFAILFNVPKRTLLGCALCGAVVYMVRALSMQFALVQIEAASLLAAMVVGFLGVLFGRRWRAPAPVFIVPGVIPLVPGVLAFRAMNGLLTLTTSTANETLLMEATINSLKTILIVCGIAGGIAIPGLLLRRHRPMT